MYARRVSTVRYIPTTTWTANITSSSIYWNGRNAWKKSLRSKNAKRKRRRKRKRRTRN